MTLVFGKKSPCQHPWLRPCVSLVKMFTEYNTPYGMFHFNRLQIGIGNAPEIFQQRLNTILCLIPNAVIYMDDVPVLGKPIQDHDCLEVVRRTLAAASIQLNDTKSHIRKKSIKFLGHVVTADGSDLTLQSLTPSSRYPLPPTMPNSAAPSVCSPLYQRLCPTCLSPTTFSVKV